MTVNERWLKILLTPLRDGITVAETCRRYSDNGLQFKSGKGHKPVYFQERLAALGVTQLSSRPRHPQTCGKLERYHRTFKEFYADQGPAYTVEELQQLCDAFRWQYNHERPHRSLDQRTPAEAYQAVPKVAAGDARPRRRKSGPRILRVSKAGSVSYRKRKLGIGQTYVGQQVTVAEFGDAVIVTHTESGRLLRELTLGPVGSYHRNGNKRGRPRKSRVEESESVVSGVLTTLCQGCPRALQFPVRRTTRQRDDVRAAVSIRAGPIGVLPPAMSPFDRTYATRRAVPSRHGSGMAQSTDRAGDPASFWEIAEFRRRLFAFLKLPRRGVMAGSWCRSRSGSRSVGQRRCK